MWVISFTPTAALPHDTALYLTWCWVGPRAHFDASEKRKMYASTKNRTPIPRPSSQQCNAIPAELMWHLPRHYKFWRSSFLFCTEPIYGRISGSQPWKWVRLQINGEVVQQPLLSPSPTFRNIVLHQGLANYWTRVKQGSWSCCENLRVILVFNLFLQCFD